MLHYKVTGMSCGHCINLITQAIHSHYPAAKVVINLKEQDVEVSEVEDLTQIAALIKEAGYEVLAMKVV